MGAVVQANVDQIVRGMFPPPRRRCPDASAPRRPRQTENGGIRPRPRQPIGDHGSVSHAADRQKGVLMAAGELVGLLIYLREIFP